MQSKWRSCVEIAPTHQNISIKPLEKHFCSVCEVESKDTITVTNTVHNRNAPI